MNWILQQWTRTQLHQWLPPQPSRGALAVIANNRDADRRQKSESSHRHWMHDNANNTQVNRDLE